MIAPSVADIVARIDKQLLQLSAVRTCLHANDRRDELRVLRAWIVRTANEA